MNETPRGPDLLAATRFVQAGRLTEATALLQRLLRGEPQRVASNTVESPPSAKSDLIDLTPDTLGVTAQRREPPAMKTVGTGIDNLPVGRCLCGVPPVKDSRSMRSRCRPPRGR